MYCKECGTEFEGGNFCPECGTNSKLPTVKKKISTKDFSSLINAKRGTKENFLKLLKNAEVDGNYHITGKGNENLIYMENEGIKTGNGLFIPYNKINLIEEKTNISRENAFAFGLIGLGAGLTLKTVEIIFIGGKITIRDVNKNDANNFVLKVREKVINAQ
jgi:phosphoribosylaminoimidazole (AIR) synthetase